jgi:hypothetical protein
MASLAGMLQTRAYRVTGSDAAAYPPMSDLLKALGIEIKEPYAEANLSPRPDLVIVGNAISRGMWNWNTCSISAYRFVPSQKPSSTNFFPEGVAGRRRNPWKDHDHQHAGLDL